MLRYALALFPSLAFAQGMPPPNPALTTPAFMLAPPLPNAARAPFTNMPQAATNIPMPGPNQTAPGRLVPINPVQSYVTSGVPIQPVFVPIPPPPTFRGEVVIR